MRLSAIVAISENRVMGKDNRLPWHLPADLKHFKEITVGKPILMGRKTYLSIGRPLPGRENVIVTRDKTFEAAGCRVFNTIQEALDYLLPYDEVFVIGGADLFKQLLPQIKLLYLTIIHEKMDGDTFFPEINQKEWREVESKDFLPDDKNQYRYSFITLERK